MDACRKVRTMSANANTGRLQGVRLLLVDDAKHVRDGLSLLLEHEQATVTAVGRGDEALEHIRQRQFDVVIVDLGLPDTPGDALIRQILGIAPTRPRVVALTAAEEPGLSRARKAGADIVLRKPVSFEEILAILRPIVGPS